MNTVDRSGPAAATSLRAGAVLVLPLCLLLAAGCQKSVEDRIAEAELQQEIGAWDESIQILQGVLDDAPDHPEANLLLGLSHLRTGQAALAIWPLELAGRDPAFSDRADLGLGAAYVQLEQYDAAVEAADRVMARNPDDPESRAGALRLRASAHLGAGQAEAAIEDVRRILTNEPGDTAAMVLLSQAQMQAGQIDEAEATLLEIWEDPELVGAPVTAKAGTSLVKLYHYHRNDAEAADRVLEVLLERHPGNAGVLGFVVDFLVRGGRGERATELLTAALENDPGDTELRTRLAELYAGQGEAEKAEALLVESTELFDSPDAWFSLAAFYRNEDRPEEALEAMDRTIELLPGQTDVLRFEHANLLADAGRLDRAEEVSREIEGETYRNMILGRIAFLRDRPEEALRLLDSALRQWPNNSGGRYLAGKAAFALGDVERGLNELQEAARANVDTDATLELALLYLNMGQPAGTLRTAALIINNPEAAAGPRLAPALLLSARAQWALAEHEPARKDVARKLVEGMAKLPGQEATAALELARFANDDSGPAAAARLLQGREGVDPASPEDAAVLRALCDYLLEAGESEAALARARSAAEAHPDSAELQDIHARVLGRLGRGEAALAAFDRALAIEDYAPALDGKAMLLEMAGDGQGALALLDRATELDPRNAAYPHHAAQIALAQGRVDEAVSRLEEALRRDPVHALASNDLAWILAERGADLDRALGLARRASQAVPTAPVLDTLGWVQYRRGEFGEAAATLERAHELDPDSPSTTYRLGLALLETGDEQRARQLFEQALDGDAPFPEAEAAKAQLARMASVQP